MAAAADLYARGRNTVLASWAAIARGSPGAAVVRRPASRRPVLLAARDGEIVASAPAFDADGDRLSSNVVTLEHARRRGLATALTALLARDALAQGLRTATVQSTEMAERMYAAVGFRDLGRILEYTPPGCG